MTKNNDFDVSDEVERAISGDVGKLCRRHSFSSRNYHHLSVNSSLDIHAARLSIEVVQHIAVQNIVRLHHASRWDQRNNSTLWEPR